MKTFHKKRVPLLLNLLLVLLVQFSWAQENIISGTVTDEKGLPVSGASIVLKGTTTGVITNVKGTFKIKVPSASSILTISSIGYATQDVVASSSVLKISLQSISNVLNDVVVIGYGTVKRKELTGSISTVSSKDFQQGAITTPEQLISGKVAGVSITSNGGSPGAGSTIRIRGGASISASNDPLIVIDGVELSGNNIYGASNSLSLINPNDIETFTILKDASATAIYGSRASNGVILITTKKGVSGKPVFSFSTQVSVSKIIKEDDVLSASAFRNYVNSNPLGDSLVNGVPFKSLLGTANTDWQKQIYQSAVETDNNLSVSGAIKKVPYRISVGYLDQDGILKTDNLQRYSGGISLSPVLFDNHLKIDVNLKGAINNTRFANNAAVSSAVYMDPTQPVYDANSPFGGYWEWYIKDPTTGAVTMNKLAPRNPLALLNLYSNTSTVQRSFGNVQFDYKFHFLPELHANLNLGYDVAKGDGKINVPAYAAQNYLDGGQKNKYANRIGNDLLEFYLNYNKTFAKIKSNINVTAGYGYYNNLSTNYNYPSFRANGDTIPGTIPQYAMDKPQTTMLSYYGRLIYTFNSRYILAASIRTDGSSRFSPSTRWATFPSVAFTWRINQEKFLDNFKKLSNLNLRLSYGTTGNQDGISPYPYQAVYSLSDNASMVQFGNTFYNMGTPAAYDADIKWEQTATFNAGLDFGFFDNRLSGSVDYYNRKTKNLLNIIPIPAGSNFASNILTNIGNVTSNGIEFTLNATPVKNKNFTWDVSFNFTYNDTKITNLTATQDSTYIGSLNGNGVQINSVGYGKDAFFVYHQVYDKSGKPIEGVYQDVNGDGKINQADLYHYKNPYAPYVLGFSTQFTYRKWSLSTVLRANIGNYMYNSLAAAAIQSNTFNPLQYLANTLSEVTKSNFYAGQQLSDYYVQNASFLKMDNLTLGYNFGRINNKVGLRVSATCQNVFTATKYTGIDPEIYGGYDNALYPRPRIYLLGINLQF